MYKTSPLENLANFLAWERHWCCCRSFTLSLLIMGLAFTGELAADEPQVLAPKTAVSRIAKLLIEQANSADMFDEPCRVYLTDREDVVGTLIAAQSFVELRDAISQELREAQPNRECEISILDVVGRPDIGQVIEKQKAKEQSGSLLSLAFFQSLGGVMMFANGYRRDGSFAMFTNRIDVALEPSGEAVPTRNGGKGGPSLPVQADDLLVEPPRTRSPNHQVEESQRSAPDKKSFLESLRERKGTELAD